MSEEPVLRVRGSNNPIGLKFDTACFEGTEEGSGPERTYVKAVPRGSAHLNTEVRQVVVAAQQDSHIVPGSREGSGQVVEAPVWSFNQVAMLGASFADEENTHRSDLALGTNEIVC